MLIPQSLGSKQFLSVPPCLGSSVSHLACCDGWNVKCLPWAQLLNSTWSVVLSGRSYRTFWSPSRRGSQLQMDSECEQSPHLTQFTLSASCSRLVTGLLTFLRQLPAAHPPCPYGLSFWTVIQSNSNNKHTHQRNLICKSWCFITVAEKLVYLHTILGVGLSDDHHYLQCTVASKYHLNKSFPSTSWLVSKYFSIAPVRKLKTEA